MTAIGQSNFLQALGWAVLNSLWQLALLWVIYQLITAVFNLRSSSGKSRLATTLLFGGFAWFVLTFLIILNDRNNSLAQTAFIDIDANPALNNWLYRSLPIASLVYLGLLILPLLNFIRNFRYVQVIRRYALKKADVQWRMFVQKVAAQMGIVKPVQVWMSDLVSSPVTIGYLKPVILLPLAAINHLSPRQVEAVLLHELSHIKRFDYLLNLIVRIIQTVLYFNPFVKAFARIIEREREKSCDEIVMQFEYEPHGYASALLTLEKASVIPTHSLAVAASGGKKNELLMRIESILGLQPKKAFSFNKLAGIMAALLCFIALHALILWSRPAANQTGNPVSALSSPLLFFSDDAETNKGVAENKPAAIINSTMEQTTIMPLVKENTAIHPAMPEAIDEADYKEAMEAALKASQFAFVNQRETILTKEQEKQVQEALEASKRVLEEGQWKVVEKSIADAMTMAEKTQVKEVYQKAAEKADWEKMEEKLRQSYGQINWNVVNTQLSNALASIKLDSLQQVYTIAVANLSGLQKELTSNNQQGVPDTDITLQSVEQKKKEINKAINKLKSIKNRKIIHL